MDSEYGPTIGIVSTIIAFIVTWIYCIATYGFLFGFGLGWIPSASIAAMIGIAMVYVWPFVAGIVVLYAIVVIVTLARS